MKTHDMKRVFQLAMRRSNIKILYSTETYHSWYKCGKLAGFNIFRPPYAVGEHYYRLADVQLIFDDNSVFWAYGLYDFAQNFIGFVGTGFENQTVYLKICP